MAARAIAADGDQTVRTTALDSLRGVPRPEEFSFRVLRNRLMDEWADREREAAADFGQMKRSYNEARIRGDFDVAATIVGEAVGLPCQAACGGYCFDHGCRGEKPHSLAARGW